MKNFLLCLFVVIGGVMNANTIKKCVAGPTAISFTVVNSACGAANGSVTLGAVTGGVAPYTYSFNGSAYTSTTSYTGLVAGTYTIIVQDSNAATYTTSATINDSPGPTAVSTTVTNSSCGASNGSVNVGSVTGGTSPYTYSFNGGGYTGTTSYTNLSAGTYSINVKDSNGCIFSSSVTIINNPGPTAVSTTVTNSSCGAANGSVTLGAVTGGTAPYTYSFNGSPYTSTTSYTGLVAGSYSIAVKDANGCQFFISVTIIDNPGPTAVSTTVTNSSCGSADGSITLGAVTGGTAPFTYSFNGSPYSSTNSYTGLIAGTYPIDVKDANGCLFTTTVTIIDNPGPTALATSVVNSSCGAANGSIVITGVTGGTPGYTYDFNSSGSFNAVTSYSGLAPATYPIIVKDANGCIYSTSATVFDNPGPNAIATTVTNSSCGAADGSITITGATGGTAPFTYSFNNPSGTGPYTATLVYNGLAAGAYTLEVKDANGCIYTTSVTIIDNPGPTAVATTTTNSSCGASDGSFTITGGTGGTAPYTYSLNGSPFTTTTTYSGLAAGTYSLLVKDANGCVYTTNVSISNSGTVAATPTASSVTQPTCAVPSGTIVIASQSGVEYSTDNGTTYQASNTFSGLAPGSYALRVRDLANNACFADNSNLIIIDAVPTAPNTPTVSSVTQPSCGVTTGTIVFTTQAGVQYSIDNGIAYQAGTTFSGLAPGTYTLTVRKAADNTCSATAASTVTINAPTGGPTAFTTTIVDASCGATNGSITFGAVTGGTAPYTYVVNGSGFSSTTTYSGLTAGTYQIGVKDANGCVYSMAATIMNSSGPTAIATTVVNASCGTSDGSVTLGAVTGGTGPYMYNFNGFGYSSTTTYSGLAAGSYYIETRDANGCAFATVISINNTGGPTAIATTVENESCPSSANGFVTLGTVTGGVAPYTYSFNGSAYTTTTNYTNLVAGTYFIDVKDTNGCIYSTSVTITTTGARSANISYTGSPYSTASTTQQYVTLTGTGAYTGGVFSVAPAGLEISPNTGTITPSSSTPGTYTVTYTLPASGGCPAIIVTTTVTISGSNYTDLSVYIYPNGGPRPGFTYNNYIYITNNGNLTTPAGTLTFTKDSRVTVTNVSPSATMNGTGFTYNYPSLTPGQYQYVIVTMQVPPIPTVNIGDLLTNSVSIDIPAGDINTANNSASTSQEVRGAYDPNDKSEAHGPQIVHSSFTSADYLSYTIQFENTGNADALNIRVNDMLDSKLDETTIKTIVTSHTYVLNQTGSDLNWNFNNINLPPAGKGYINFQIKPKAGYAIGDIINNTASIYFDSNPAIVTNPVATEFVTTFGVTGFVNSQFSAYPNPTTGIITINLKNSAAVIDAIIVTDVLGKTVKTNSVNNANTTVDLSHLSKGLYFVKIQAEGQVNTLKVIKE